MEEKHDYEIEENHDHLNNPVAGAVTNLGNRLGTRGLKQACAACKYQRKKCSQDCLLAPFFPGDKPGKFSNAHRLFGVSNMLKILKSIKPDDRDEAMTSITYESDIRAKHPVHGCLGVIREYQNEISRTLKELAQCKILLAHYKEGNQNLFQSHFSMNRYSLSSSTCVDFPAQTLTPIDNNCEVPCFGGNAINSHGPYSIENQASSLYASVLDQERFNLDDCSSSSLAEKNTMMIRSSSTLYPMNQSSLPSVGGDFPTPTTTPVDNNCETSFGGNVIHSHGDCTIENRATSSYPRTQ